MLESLRSWGLLFLVMSGLLPLLHSLLTGRDGANKPNPVRDAEREPVALPLFSFALIFLSVLGEEISRSIVGLLQVALALVKLAEGK